MQIQKRKKLKTNLFMRKLNVSLTSVLVIVCCSLLYTSDCYNYVIFEGDIVLRFNPHDRAAILLTGSKWSNGVVPYKFIEPIDSEDAFSDVHKQLIRSAMDYIEEQSCTTFVELDNSDDNDVENNQVQDYVGITTHRGCSAELGRQRGYNQLSLDTSYCMDHGTIVHELMHSLGFIHEHSRVDRDEHIEILWENIAEQYKKDFQIYSSADIDHLGFEYDLRSVMHYESSAGAIESDSQTLKPLDASISDRELGLGKKLGYLTQLDKLKLNKFYECNKDNE